VTIHAQPTLPEGGKARRVYLSLRDEISNGSLAPGARLPGEHRLAESFAVSRVTIRRALDALAADGWIEKRTGSGIGGARAGPTISRIAADLTTLMPQLVEMGPHDDRAASVLFLCPGPARGRRRPLACRAARKVQTAVRVRLLEGRAVFAPHHPCARGHRASYSRGRPRTHAAVPKLLERAACR
jgi:GntR family transcriptional regulator